MSASVPDLTANAGVYVLQWIAEDVRITLDRLDDRNHSTTGEVTIKYRPPESTDFHHLHQARLNLTSTNSRNGLAKYLTERVEHIDWADVLEQTCVKTLAKHREGEPLRMIGNLPVAERPKYLSYPLLLAEQPNLFYGTYGAAKTTLAAKTALETEVNTLWLDYEWCMSEVNHLVRRLKGGMALDPEAEIAYRFCSQPLADDILSIQKMVLETQAELVIVDSVGAACGGDPMDPGVILRYFAALRSLKVTTLSLDHVAKEARGPFGSVYKMNCARNAWETVRGTSDNEHLAVGLHHRKVNSGPLLAPLGFKFTYTADSVIPKPTDARTIPEVLATMALADQIEAALTIQAMTPAELAEELGKPTSTLSPILSRHKDKFIKVGGGKWAVKTNEAPDDVSL